MRRYVYALAAATIMSVAMPVMAEETSTEEETSIEVDGTEESATGEDRASEIEKLIQQLEKQIAALEVKIRKEKQPKKKFELVQKLNGMKGEQERKK